MDLRACFVVNSVGETSVPATIARGIVDHTDIDVDVLAWFEAEPFSEDEILDVVCLDAPRTTLGVNGSTYLAAREHLREYDILQLHHNHSGSLSKLIGHSLGLPMVSREGNTRNGFTRWGRVANGVTNSLVDRIVCNSQPVYDSFTRWERFLIDDEDVRIIPNGVDLARLDRAANREWDLRSEFGIPADSILVGSTVVISEQKAMGILVEAIRRAYERSDYRFDLVIAGDGPLRGEIELAAAEGGIGDRVHMLGMVDRETVYQFLGKLDIYAMPSRWEGFANAAVEALGAGNACVFSDIDPFQVPYRDVALFHPVDNAAVLTERLLELAENPDVRELLALRGRELIERKYTLQRVAEQYADLYSVLV